MVTSQLGLGKGHLLFHRQIPKLLKFVKIHNRYTDPSAEASDGGTKMRFKTYLSEVC